MAGPTTLLDPGRLTRLGVPGSPYAPKMLAVLRYRRIPCRLILASHGAPGDQKKGGTFRPRPSL